MAVQRILVPVDYSDRCRHALSYAIFLADKLGATVDVVHIWDRPAYVPETMVVGKPGTAPKSLADLIRENAEADMTDFLGKTQVPPGMSVAHHLESGEPASTILETAKKSGTDLIVMGTHGRTGVRHFLLGSVAEKLVRLSPVPVLTVPDDSTQT
ncbi:MAG TPA: universal stress protein [Polyangiaceae bacterium]|nr:universal stress protein [Polyangiaceae bacterium]HMR73664.1 universal stress protein [Polyangiaceae bacterium]